MVARSSREIEGLRRAGRATARLLVELAAQAKPGVRTAELDAYAAAYIRRIGGDPVFHTQNGFPACINTSIDDEAVHGVPGERRLRAGDLLSIDCGIGLGGYCGDATITVGVGASRDLSPRKRQVMEVAREALRRGIAAARVGNRVGDIGHAMQSYVATTGCQLLPQFTGHGLGSRLWEKPEVPAIGRVGFGAPLVEGLVITIEPIVAAGTSEVYFAEDGWTALTADGEPAAQFEHTIIITSRGARVLTAA